MAQIPTHRMSAAGSEIRRTWRKNPVVVGSSCFSRARKKLGIPIAVAPIKLS